MAAITTNDNNRKHKAGFARRKQLSLRIDMTPMVDLGFLLITFFIFTSTMSQPTTMSLNMPKDGGDATAIKESGALTILSAENGKIYYYEGLLNPANVHTSSLKEIRNVIINKKRQTPDKSFFVVIKPTEEANYGNIVDILDEMTISNVKRYALADISQEEKVYIN
jgi:biopolymer transport protein ExbD